MSQLRVEQVLKLLFVLLVIGFALGVGMSLVADDVAATPPSGWFHTQSPSGICFDVGRWEGYNGIHPVEIVREVPC